MALIDNIVAYYKMQGNSNDSVASNNGTDAAGIVYDATYGKIDQGVQAGTAGTSKVNVPSGTYAIVSGAAPTFTISGWIKFTGSFAGGSNGLEIFTIKVGASIRCALWMSEDSSAPNGRLHILMRNTAGTLQENIQAVNRATATYFHFAVTYTGGVYQAYIDGSTANSISATIQNATANDGYIYHRSTGSPVTPQGDEIGFWSRALSAAEITELYNGGAGLQYPFGAGANSNFFAFM